MAGPGILRGARSLGEVGAPFPLIVVLLEGQTAPGLPFLRQLHWIVTPDPASEKDVARIFDAASGRGAAPPELWRYASPYRGLEAMEEKDSDYFFGRTRETIEALTRSPRQAGSPVLIGNSGVGKSSLAQAGVLAALKRQAWPGDAGASDAWPAVFQNSRQWCFLTLKPGAEPIKALVDCFLDAWQFEATDPSASKQQQGWIELLQGKAKLSDLIDATERRREELDQPKPPAFFLYVDQGEELYARAGEQERRRFSELLAEALADPRLRAMMSMRSDFLGSLQSDKPLFTARLLIDVPPLGEDELARGGEPAGAIARGAFRERPARRHHRAARRGGFGQGRGRPAAPLLHARRHVERDAEGRRRRAAASRAILRARRRAGRARQPRFSPSVRRAEDALRRILTLKLATVREDGEPTRRRALRAEFSDEEWRLVSELAGYPNRLLVTATTEAGETYAEVAHEAIFRRWDKLREWIAGEREFLAWRSGLEAARRAWENDGGSGQGRRAAHGLRADAGAEAGSPGVPSDIPEADRTFIAQSRKAARRRKRRAQALVGALVAAMAVGAAAWWNQDWLKEETLCAGERDSPRRRRRSAPSRRATRSRSAAIARKWSSCRRGDSRWARPKAKARRASIRSTR